MSVRLRPPPPPPPHTPAELESTGGPPHTQTASAAAHRARRPQAMRFLSSHVTSSFKAERPAGCTTGRPGEARNQGMAWPASVSPVMTGPTASAGSPTHTRRVYRLARSTIGGPTSRCAPPSAHPPCTLKGCHRAAAAGRLTLKGSEPCTGLAAVSN